MLNLVGNSMMRIIKILMPIMLFVYGLFLIADWVENLPNCKEADSFEEIQGAEVGDYVSFYIDYYASKEAYVEDKIEYEIYTILEERDTESNVNFFIQVMVKNEETKQKLNNMEDGRVYFQGVLLDDSNGSFEFGKEWETFVPEGMEEYRNVLCGNWVIKETEIPSKGYDIYLGIVLIILSVIIYRALGGIEDCVPNIELKSNKFDEYNFEHYTQTYNIHSELLNEKDNLKNLQSEWILNKKASNILIAIFVLGFLIVIGDASVIKGSLLGVISLIIKMIGCVCVFVGLCGVWSRFINSSHKLAIYIAHKFKLRSVYIEIEVCKKNIVKLEKIIEERNL